MSDRVDTERGEPFERAISRLDESQTERYDRLVASLEPGSSADRHRAHRELDEAIDDLEGRDRDRLLRGALLARRAEIRLDRDRVQGARSDVDEAIDCGWRSIEVHVTGGWANYDLDRPGAAREHFQTVLEVDPDRVSALTGRSLALIEIEELELARADLTHALKLEPDNAELYSLRAEVLAGLNELDRAERDVEQAMELARGDPEYALDRARLAMVRARTDRALEAVERALDREETLEGLLLRSHLHRIADRDARARRDAIHACNAYPDRAFAFVQLAQIELGRGELQLAERAAERAVALDAKLPDAYMVRGLVRRTAGRDEQARSDLERAREASSELPMFLLGSFYDVLPVGHLDPSMMDMVGEMMDGTAGGPGGGLGGMDPADLMGQMFDESGQIDERFRPAFEMALDNAPDLFDQLPDELVDQLGGVDEEKLESLSDMSSEEMEQRLRTFYEWLDDDSDGSEPPGGSG
ncbi:MAG: tetratricopeptide repeat protein [Bradymonadaceae bacterium]